MMIRPTAAALLLVLAAAASVDTTVAITANPVWTSSSSLIQSQTAAGTSSEDTLGELCVDEEGNFFSPHVTAAQSHHDLLSLRGGSLCVDPDGNFYSPRLACPQEQSTAVTRGGCAGGSSIKTSPKNRSVLRRRNESNTQKEPAAAAPKCAQSSATAALATGGYLKNDRLGGLCTDADGNLYGTPTTTAFVALPRR